MNINNLHNTIEHAICLINEKINQQINVIIHHSRFQRLEATWRGIKLLVDQKDQHSQVHIRLLNLSARELSKDMLGAIEFDQSRLFEKIYSEQFDQPGGTPFGIILGDYSFSHKSSVDFKDSVSVLAGITKVAATAFVPFVSSVAPELFGINCFTELQSPFRMDDLFRQRDYHRWKILRQDADARFVGLTLPRTLMRKPYNHHSIKYTHRFFSETIKKHADYCWGNACYAYGCVAINAFVTTGWFADMRGIQQNIHSGGTIKHLSRDSFNTDRSIFDIKFSTEYNITDTQEKTLSDYGFLALCDNPLLETAVFYSSQSIQLPAHYTKNIATANAKVSSMLHYLMCVSRFAHYVKIIMRNKLGTFINAKQCQHFLQNWLHSYCTNSQELSLTAQARYPLQEAKVTVNEQTSSPGKYYCTIQLKPHYQFDEIQTYLKLVTNIHNLGGNHD